jgi:hypothetical protein
MEIIPEMPYAYERWTRNKTAFGGPLFFYPILPGPDLICKAGIIQASFARY